jgi:hypothetical protein
MACHKTLNQQTAGYPTIRYSIESGRCEYRLLMSHVKSDRLLARHIQMAIVCCWGTRSWASHQKIGLQTQVSLLRHRQIP